MSVCCRANKFYQSVYSTGPASLALRLTLFGKINSAPNRNPWGFQLTFTYLWSPQKCFTNLHGKTSLDDKHEIYAHLIILVQETIA